MNYETEAVNDNAKDPTLLLVKGNIGEKRDTKDYIKKLASAMLVVVEKHGVAKLRCVGAAAINNAVKSQIVANGEAKKKGLSLIMTASFQTVHFTADEDRTAIVIEVETIENEA
ncbi:MAG: stage V sporulation protein S [Phenylobacterium sp.]